MHYTLHQLKIFLKVAETGSITRAAEELHLTQPAVSIQLKKLQEQFDLPLIEVIGRKLYITELGKVVAHHGKRVVEEFDAIRYKVEAYKGQMTGKLTISLVSTAKYVMPYFLSGFMQRNPGVDLVMDVTNKGTVLHHLKNNLVDFAMVSVLPENLSVDRMQFMENRLFLVGANQRDPGITAEEALTTQPLIFREQGSATRQAMERFLNDRHIASHKPIELTSNEAVKQAVLAGLGYSIMPLIGIKNELLNHDLHILPHPDLPVITHWNMVWLKGKQFTPVSQAWLQYLSEERSHVIEEQFSWYDKEYQ